MKKVTLTADYTTSITREIEVEDDFDPANTDLDDLFFSKDSTRLSRGEIQNAVANLQIDEVWLVKNDKGEEIYVK